MWLIVGINCQKVRGNSANLRNQCLTVFLSILKQICVIENKNQSVVNTKCLRCMHAMWNNDLKHKHKSKKQPATNILIILNIMSETKTSKTPKRHFILQTLWCNSSWPVLIYSCHVFMPLIHVFYENALPLYLMYYIIQWIIFHLHYSNHINKSNKKNPVLSSAWYHSTQLTNQHSSILSSI